MINSDVLTKIKKSLQCSSGNINSMDDILAWIENKRKSTEVDIHEVSVSDDTFWFYDDQRGEILNRKRSFFSIVGLRHFVNNKFISEQPIILQNEVGFLGIIAKEIDGVINFLMQAKIEPGNINYVQISPTIQATKSNFTRAHGGHLPSYYEFFENAAEHGQIIYDQFQSEQGNRFLAKKNRNIVVLTDEDVEVYPDYMWMTLGQIKELLKMDNVINMDSRTVLSGIVCDVSDVSLAQSEVQYAYHMLNTYRMYNVVNNVQIPLNQLMQWDTVPAGIFSSEPADFEVKYYDIKIEGREVQDWIQPLFKATSEALFVLFTAIRNDRREFLIHIQPEIGCADLAEFGPTIQLANSDNVNGDDFFVKWYRYFTNIGFGIKSDVMLSEEGGRFYREQNRNVIIEVDPDIVDCELVASPGDQIPSKTEYLWVSYDVLMQLMNSGHCLNIQLRSLISLLTEF